MGPKATGHVVEARVPLPAERKKVMERLAELNGPPAGILLIAQGHAQNYIPEPLRNPRPPSLKAIYRKDMAAKPIEEVQKECLKIVPNLHLTKPQITAIEQLTRGQRESADWPKYRAGRITGSTFHQALRTKVEAPSISLLVQICYPYQQSARKQQGSTISRRQPRCPEPLRYYCILNIFKCAHFLTCITTFARWGIDNEPKALASFEGRMMDEKEHDSFKINSVGLFISETHPYLAASPDGVVTCPCHGDYLIEIKCPFTHRHSSVKDAAEKDAKFPLRLSLPDGQGSFEMSKTHPYYYQVQLQMFVTGIHRCFFIVFTNVDLVYVLVKFDTDFMASKLHSAQQFWEKCVLPEMLTGCFTASRRMIQQDPAGNKENSYLPCWCQLEMLGEKVIHCSNPSCMVKIFHLKCVAKKLKRIPSNWKCDLCKKKAAKQKREEKKQKTLTLR